MNSLLTALDKVITEHGSAAILRERVALLRDQVQALVQRFKEVEDECGKLREENRQLKAQIEAQARPQEWREHRGGLFKPAVGGGFEPDVYCPNCKIPMTSLAGELPYRRSLCRRTVDFTGHALAGVIRGLRQNQGV